jgi:hypothetical protein
MPAQDVGYWEMMATSQTRLSLWQAQVKDKFTRRNVIREDAEKGVVMDARFNAKSRDG